MTENTLDLATQLSASPEVIDLYLKALHQKDGFCLQPVTAIYCGTDSTGHSLLLQAGPTKGEDGTEIWASKPKTHLFWDKRTKTHIDTWKYVPWLQGVLSYHIGKTVTLLAANEQATNANYVLALVGTVEYTTPQSARDFSTMIYRSAAVGPRSARSLTPEKYDAVARELNRDWLKNGDLTTKSITAAYRRINTPEQQPAESTVSVEEALGFIRNRFSQPEFEDGEQILPILTIGGAISILETGNESCAFTDIKVKVGELECELGTTEGELSLATSDYKMAARILREAAAGGCLEREVVVSRNVMPKYLLIQSLSTWSNTSGLLDSKYEKSDYYPLNRRKELIEKYS